MTFGAIDACPHCGAVEVHEVEPPQRCPLVAMGIPWMCNDPSAGMAGHANWKTHDSDEVESVRRCRCGARWAYPETARELAARRHAIESEAHYLVRERDRYDALPWWRRVFATRP
ncbi:hypothetical protein SEA_FOSTEROUS_24 [Gordonia phage Fosterous]|uniref:Uncharacterized protein n=1 Tax=Gordonia phage Fosterous TaxID=2483668 RepID=A0A3G3M8K5_9CAUD|nr:hypothetical protein KNU19_gp24 [Gordonia phage Fosterous]AYR02745.1 hypothetical protein SEA_FOSTEROUS_24 [Gordonia phage Fosterous]